MLSKTLITALLTASVMADIQSIQVHTTSDIELKADDLHDIFMSLGGTFNLSSSGHPELRDAYLSDIYLGGSSTNVSSAFADLFQSAGLEALLDTSGNDEDQDAYGKHRIVRAPSPIYTESSCYAPPKLNTLFFSQKTQEFLDGPACKTLTKGISYGSSLVALGISNVYCAKKLSGALNYGCQIIVTLTATAGSNQITPKFDGVCTASLAMIRNLCGSKGGEVDVGFSGVTGKTEVVETATSSNDPFTCSPTGYDKSTGQFCSTYKCSSKHCNS